MRGLQDTRTPLLVMVGTTVLNLVLELVLIYGYGFGIGASALATVVAQSLGAIVYVWFVARGASRTSISIRPDLSAIRSLLYVGLHLFLRTISLRGVLLASTAVSARIGTHELGANQITLEIWNFLAFALDSIAIAGQAITGRLLGAGRAEEARAAGRRMIELGIVFGILLGLVIAATRWLIAPIFSSDAEVVRLTAYLLLFAAAFQPVAATAFVLDGVLIGAGDQRYLAWAMFGAALVFIAGAVAVVAFDLGIGALWLAIGAFMTARAVSLLHRFSTPHWQVLGER
jgi:putative MATE family efflux protein